MWVILVGKGSTLSNTETPHKIITAREYLSAPKLFKGVRPKIINLAASYSYQSRGYYASLLAGARGHRVLPGVETLVDLSGRQLYENSLPELEDALNKAVAGGAVPKTLSVFFGSPAEKRFERFARLLFDWYRAPALEVETEPVANSGTGRLAIRRISIVPFQKLAGSERERFLAAMDAYTGKEWRKERHKTPARYTIAVLQDPAEELPPSSQATIRYWAKFAAKTGVEVKSISRKDLSSIAEYDALFIRETTSISNHTFRFARRAEQEGMPVIDDTVSMIRCTNKVYLHELLGSANIPMPPSCTVGSLGELEYAADTIGFPMVVKIPDGSFSRGVKKAASMDELKALATAWFKDTELLICQKFMPTEFDWRVGVLGGKPLFVSQYLMAKKHWQIVNHREGKRPDEGGFRVVSLAEAPPAPIEMATAAAAMIGDGLYGVDIKETQEGFFVIEVNDNPNLEHGVEDAAEKDEVWTRLTQWFIDRIDG